jgi:hypothetical protein
MGCTTSSSTHSWGEECDSRSFVHGATNSEDDGIESQSGCSLSDFSDLHSQHRSVCGEGKSETNSNLFSLSRSPSLRCDAKAVDRIGVFAYAFPPPILIPKVLQKSKSSVLTKAILASGSTKSVKRFSKGTTDERDL